MSLRWLSLLLGALLLRAAPAGALTASFAVDPAASSLVPATGSPQSLSGSLGFELGALPVPGVATSFDLIDLALTTSGGDSIGLDPAVATPGLGVLRSDGSFTIPTLFLHLEGAQSLDLALPDVTGQVAFGPGGASLLSLAAAFAIDAGPPSGLVSVTLNAVVPEPGTVGLLAAGLVALGLAQRRRKEDCR